MAWCYRLGQHSVSDDIPHAILSRFDVAIAEHRLGMHLFRVLHVRNPDVLLDAISPTEFSADERLPYWAELWTSSLALAEFCLARKPLDGMRVLDLGCGLGLTGIAAARNGAHVVFTDYEQDALLFAQWNARANLDPVSFTRTEFCLADWRHPDSLGMYDVVLGADIVYERRNFQPLLGCLRATVRRGGEAWLAEPDRSLADDFFRRAQEEGWAVDIGECERERRGRTSRIRIAVIRNGGTA